MSWNVLEDRLVLDTSFDDSLESGDSPGPGNIYSEGIAYRLTDDQTMERQGSRIGHEDKV